MHPQWPSRIMFRQFGSRVLAPRPGSASEAVEGVLYKVAEGHFRYRDEQDECTPDLCASGSLSARPLKFLLFACDVHLSVHLVFCSRRMNGFHHLSGYVVVGLARSQSLPLSFRAFLKLVDLQYRVGPSLKTEYLIKNVSTVI